MEDEKGSNGQITTIFLTGANGQLGSALRRKWSQDEYQSKFCVVASHHDILDISDKDEVNSALEQFCPDIVVNCAGFNAPCLSQQDRDACWSANAFGTRNLAEACAKRKAIFVHVSCDSVFGADDHRYTMLTDINRLYGLGFCVDDLDCRYTEKSVCGPVDFGGACKLAGEQAVTQVSAAHPNFRYWILRPGNVFEYPWRTTRGFLYSLALMIKGHKKELYVPADVLFSLCYAPEAAKAIGWMLENRDSTKKNGSLLMPSGVYHLANEGGVSWFQVANQLVAGLGGSLDRIKPITLSDYRKHCLGDMPPLGGLGRYRVLSTDKYNSLGGPLFSPWKEVLDDWCAAFSGASAAVV